MKTWILVLIFSYHNGGTQKIEIPGFETQAQCIAYLDDSENITDVVSGKRKMKYVHNLLNAICLKEMK